MLVVWLLAALFLAFLLVVLVRALAFQPKEPKKAIAKDIPADEARLTASLQAMLRLPTVSEKNSAQYNPKTFVEFRNLLRERYPLVFSKSAYEEIGENGILLRLKGREEGMPSVFMAHYDVVPVEEALWSRPPFSGEVVDGEIWGRGAIDTKCTLMSILEAAEDLLKAGFVPKNDVYLSFGGDEEVLGEDASAIVDALGKRGIRPAFVLDEGGAIVEKVFPGVSRSAALIGTSEKGSAFVDLVAMGKSGHASAPPAKQAVTTLAKAIQALQKRPLPFVLSKPALELFDTLGRHSTFVYKIIFANLWCFSPLLNLICKKSGGELNALVRTTAAFTRLSASLSYNVLPETATMGLNLRLIPGDSIRSTIKRLETAMNNPDIKINLIKGSEPSPVSPTTGEGWERLCQAISATYPQALISPYLMVAASDSRHFCRVSEHVYRFSGFPLSLAQRQMIHSQDERIPISLLMDGYRFYYRLMENM